MVLHEIYDKHEMDGMLLKITVPILQSDMVNGDHFYNAHNLPTHWGRDTMTATLQTTLQMSFLGWKCLNLEQNSLMFVPNGPINNIYQLCKKKRFNIQINLYFSS